MRLGHETAIDIPGRIPLGATAPGGAGVPVREAHARAGWVMLPRSAVAFRIEGTAPIENLVVCRRCLVLMSPRTSLDKRVELVSYLTFLPRTKTPGYYGPRRRADAVDDVRRMLDGASLFHTV